MCQGKSERDGLAREKDGLDFALGLQGPEGDDKKAVVTLQGHELVLHFAQVLYRFMYMYMHACMHVCTHTHTHTRYACVCVCVHVCIYMRTHAKTHTHRHPHTDTHLRHIFAQMLEAKFVA